jgi:hypothetical protein
MPVIFRHRGFKYYFFANENRATKEPIHIHVEKAEKAAKFWIENEVVLAEAYNLSTKELAEIEEIVIENQDIIIARWKEFFGE